MKNALLTLVCCLLTTTFCVAQETENQVEEGTINHQFDELMRKSSNYSREGRRYEVVRLAQLNELRKNISDTIILANGTIAELRSTIAENESAINSLNTKVSETTAQLNELTQEKDSMSFFGNMVSKSTYKLLVWGIIFALGVALSLFIYKFRNSNVLTKQAKARLTDLEEEYEQHRRRALEREQKISRQLHDEMNKNKKGA